MIERSAKRARPIRRIPRQGRRRLHPPACARCAQGMVGARWPQPGVTLTDWIVDRVRHNTMNVFKVPQSLADKYHGAGYALAATVAGQLVDIVYLADMLPDFGGQDGPTRADAQTAIDEPVLAPTVRHLQALGSVHMGMLSGWAFVEL
ncbi:hypothetical protein Veis_3760 [Verminephrobacter eiseniae EF01-2]|uniref:Uncharacterized protein n=2 Tax=Verminephrobacter eiseniae TaxID=364317 RepID=A1WPB5_VEREI|nr:hypothetical protein Veis_3760 [Verminephrobacter eiseniae EF01-2]